MIAIHLFIYLFFYRTGRYSVVQLKNEVMIRTGFAHIDPIMTQQLNLAENMFKQSMNSSFDSFFAYEKVLYLK